MIITANHLLRLRSKRNGFNKLVKRELLKVGNVEDKKLWPKEMVGKEIPIDLFRMLEKYKDTHLHDYSKFVRLMNTRIK